MRRLRAGSFFFVLTAGIASMSVTADAHDYKKRFSVPRNITTSTTGPLGGTDPSVLSMADSAMSIIVKDLDDALTQRFARFKTIVVSPAKGDFGGAQQSSQNAASSEPVQDFAKSGFGSWAQVFGLDLQPETTRPFDSETGFSGATVGFDIRLSDDAVGGFLFGGSTGTISDNELFRDVEASSFYMGVYATQRSGKYFFDFAVTGGVATQGTRRYDFETTNATAKYTSYFINPVLTVSTATELGGQVVIPSLKLSYAGYLFDEYSEQGSAQSLNVSSRSAHFLTARAQFATPFEKLFTDGTTLSLQARGGMNAILNFSGEADASNRQGLNLALESDNNDQAIGAFLGADVTYTLTNGVLFFGELEGVAYTSGDLEGLAQFGTRFSF